MLVNNTKQYVNIFRTIVKRGDITFKIDVNHLTSEETQSIYIGIIELLIKQQAKTEVSFFLLICDCFPNDLPNIYY